MDKKKDKKGQKRSSSQNSKKNDDRKKKEKKETENLEPDGELTIMYELTDESTDLSTQLNVSRYREIIQTADDLDVSFEKDPIIGTVKLIYKTIEDGTRAQQALRDYYRDLMEDDTLLANPLKPIIKKLPADGNKIKDKKQQELVKKKTAEELGYTEQKCEVIGCGKDTFAPCSYNGCYALLCWEHFNGSLKEEHERVCTGRKSHKGQSLRSQKDVYLRMLIVTNLPSDTTPGDLQKFLLEAMMNAELLSKTDNIVDSCAIVSDKGFALLKFKKEEICKLAATLTGIIYKGRALKLKAPQRMNIEDQNRALQKEEKKSSATAEGKMPEILPQSSVEYQLICERGGDFLLEDRSRILSIRKIASGSVNGRNDKAVVTNCRLFWYVGSHANLEEIIRKGFDKQRDSIAGPKGLGIYLYENIVDAVFEACPQSERSNKGSSVKIILCRVFIDDVTGQSQDSSGNSSQLIDKPRRVVIYDDQLCNPEYELEYQP